MSVERTRAAADQAPNPAAYQQVELKCLVVCGREARDERARAVSMQSLIRRRP
jgi:hypothetical protein